MKLLEILLEQEKILVPRRIEGRPEKHIRATQQRIQQYIKDGSKGDLNFKGTPITSLPNNLKVRVDLYIENSALAKKYTDEEIRNLADIGGKIYR